LENYERLLGKELKITNGILLFLQDLRYLMEIRADESWFDGS